jgi:hypothetical protein
MCIQLQEADLECIEDKIQEIIELSRSVVKGGKDEIVAGFSISIRCKELQELINKGTLQEV